uniref:ImmA/IrrE family metallo-endopeptidase n=2 Tax=Pseudomonadota TaxID=1224 RepID=UPI0030EC03B2
IGISLIVEDPLPGMRLDGAALKTTSGRLVVGLTLRDTRLEMFWFTLMHLVAHIVLHVGQNHYDAIFDELDAPADTAIEEDADTFARELLVPSGKWAKCKSQYCWTRKSIVEDACRLGVGPAVIEGHIRRLYGDARVQPRLTPNIDVRKLLKP